MLFPQCQQQQLEGCWIQTLDLQGKVSINGDLIACGGNSKYITNGNESSLENNFTALFHSATKNAVKLCPELIIGNIAEE